MQKKIIEFLGWIGVVCLVGAFIALTFEFVNIRDGIYLALNIIGSLCIGIDAYAQRNYQPVVLQIVWGSIALIGLIRVVLM